MVGVNEHVDVGQVHVVTFRDRHSCFQDHDLHLLALGDRGELLQLHPPRHGPLELVESPPVEHATSVLGERLILRVCDEPAVKSEGTPLGAQENLPGPG